MNAEDKGKTGHIQRFKNDFSLLSGNGGSQKATNLWLWECYFQPIYALKPEDQFRKSWSRDIFKCANSQ